MEPDDLLEVYSTDNATQAEILRTALHNEGLKCEIDGESQAGFPGVNALQVKLLVRAADFDRARKFIEAHIHHD